MVPTKLTLSNFMCYRADGAAGSSPALDLDGLHVVCLSGENGAGKSALLDAITWALWGEARMPDDDLIAQGQSEMFVELEFQLGDLLYRIRRARQRGGTGKRGGQTPGKSQLDLQVQNGVGWRALSEIGVRETQAAINAILRMSYQTFINASFLLQGRADEFTARTPSERKEVLADILDLGEYEALAVKAREQSKGFADQLTGLRGRLTQLLEEADKAPFWRSEVENAETKVQSLADKVAAAEVAAQGADEARRALEQKAEQRKTLLRRLDELRREQAARERQIGELQLAIGRAEALLGRRAEIQAGLAALAAARDEAERLDALRDRWEEQEDRRKELQTQLREALGELRSDRDRAAQRHDDLARRAARRDKLAAELTQLETDVAALAPLTSERQTRGEELQAVELQLGRLRELQLRHAELDGAIKLRLDSLVGAREEQARALRRLDGQLADEPRWRRELAEAEAATARLAADELRLSATRDEERAAVELAGEKRGECARLKEAADKLKANQALLDTGAGACPICHSELGQVGVARVHSHYADELQTLRAQYAAASREAGAADERVAATRAAVGELEAGLKSLRATAARAESLSQQVAQAALLAAERLEHQRSYDDLQAQIAAGDYEPAMQAERAVVARDLQLIGDPNELAHTRGMLLERLGELDARLQARGRLEGEAEARRATLRELDADLAALPALAAEVAELERRLAENDFAHEVRQAGRQVIAAIEALGYSQEAHTAAREASRELRGWEEEARALAGAEEGLTRDMTILRQTQELRDRDAAAIEAAAREDALLADELRQLPELTAQLARLQVALGEARRDHTVAQKDLGEKQGYLKKAEQAARDLDKHRDEERRLVERQGLFAELAEAFGKKGVQAMLIETAIPQIEDEANRLLGRMTDGQMHLSFEMQRDTKKGDTVETLEIKIADALGTRVYDAFSGGEAMRANFAVRIALSRLLARRAGARLETLVIDEGFGSLDALGRERMVEAITTVQDDFRRIIVITHIDELKDRFPAQIEVIKTPLGSMWELR